MSQQRIAVVSGGNKGIGLAIVRNLALQYADSSIKSGPFLIYLTARSADRGAAAIDSLHHDPQLVTAKALARDGGATTLIFHELDISHRASIHRFRDHLTSTHPDGLDIVVNNAGIALQGFSSAVVQQTLQTNYYGTLAATQALLPLLRSGGRLVNVSSQSGQLNGYSDARRDAFHLAARTDVPAVTALIEAFQQAVDQDREKDDGFPSSAYAVSKAGETASTLVIATEEARRGRGVLVNACCPGFTNTEMTGWKGVKTVDEGARTPVLLAMGEISGRTGGYWSKEKEVEW